MFNFLNLQVTLSRINTPELDMVNLRQWVHITVKLQFPVQGLYIQTIVGPMGKNKAQMQIK